MLDSIAWQTSQRKLGVSWQTWKKLGVLENPWEPIFINFLENSQLRNFQGYIW
jgi:hypothetical protein